MGLQRGTRFGVLVLLAALVTACDDGTSPEANFDAQQTAAAMQDMVGAVNAEEMAHAAASLSAASDVFAGGVAASLAPEPVSPSVATLQGLADLGAADIFPVDLPLGTTYVWSETELSYVPSELTGAPSDGIRILYYAVDPFTHQPASPLNELGYVDLRDLSTMDSNRLGVTVVSTSGETDVTLADYYLDLAYTLTQASLTVDVASVGYLSNGLDQLNFDIAQSMSLTDAEIVITQDYTVDLEGTDKSMSFSATLTGDPQSQSEDPGAMEAEAMITGNGQSVRLELSWDGSALDGTMYSNTVPVVLISGTLDQPVFTNMDGDPLTQEELQALQGVWEAIGEIFDFVDGLFSFAA